MPKPIDYKALIRAHKRSYQPPTLTEGFKDRIITVFWKFEGDEEQSKRYMMWLEF